MSWALALLLEFYVIAARGGMFHAPADLAHRTAHAGTLQLVVYMGRDHRRQTMDHCAETSLQRTFGAAGPVAPHMPAAIYVDEDYMGRVKQVPSRPVVGASGRPLGLCWPNGFVLWPQVTEAPEGPAQSHPANSGTRNYFLEVK